MRETHLGDVVGELVRQLPIAEEPIALLGHAPPGAQMHLVDARRSVERLAPAAVGEPRAVAPGETVELLDYGGRARLIRLETEGVRIGLQRDRRARAGSDLELVARSLGHARQEELPDAIARMEAHRVVPAVPAVPVADHGDAPRVRRPDGEDDARHAVEDCRMSAQLVVDAVVRALAQEVEV